MSKSRTVEAETVQLRFDLCYISYWNSTLYLSKPNILNANMARVVGIFQGA